MVRLDALESAQRADRPPPDRPPYKANPRASPQLRNDAVLGLNKNHTRERLLVVLYS
jgi:hypothetical protein